MTMQRDTGNPLFAKQALALQWAIHELQLLPATEPYTPAHLGRHIVINVMLPFATELALKGLLDKEYPSKEPRRIHDLAALYANLPSGVRNQVDSRFMRYQRSDPHQIPTPTSMAAFLAMHKDDFERWRYLDDAAEIAPPEEQKFQYALSALLDSCFACEDAPLRTGGSLPS